MKTVYKLAERGEIPGNRIEPRWRFSRRDILALVSDKHRRGSGAEDASVPGNARGTLSVAGIEAYEVIFVDDGSRGNSRDVLRRLCRQEPRMKRGRLLRGFSGEAGGGVCLIGGKHGD